jgi:hypothetical protein
VVAVYDTISDLMASDARIQLADDGKAWTDRGVRNLDSALAELQNRTNGYTRILKDTKTSAPILFLEEANLGGYVGLNNPPGSNGRRIIQVLQPDESRTGWAEGARRTAIHEICHDWDETVEGNPYMAGFTQLHNASSKADDYVRTYGMRNALEDWTTCCEVEMGYRTSGFPQTPSAILQQKLQVVDSFFNYLATHA